MQRRRIAFATWDGAPGLTPDDRLALPALAAAGVDVVPAVWSDPAVDWRGFRAVVLRSTWDYHHRADEFRAWLDRLETDDVAVWNPVSLARWNMDKRYLRELAERGVSTVPTAWISGGAADAIEHVMAERGWMDAVLKPVVAATSYRTVRLRCDTVGTSEETRELLTSTLEHGEAMLQPFVPQVESEGEWSLMFFAGEYSHAVLKRPAAGDFRVQQEFGGSSLAVDAPRALRASARRVLDAVEQPWLYARVDGVRDADGQLLLMELEMLEPLLFLAQHPDAPARFARAIHDAIVAGAPLRGVRSAPATPQ